MASNLRIWAELIAKLLPLKLDKITMSSQVMKEYLSSVKYFQPFVVGCDHGANSYWRRNVPTQVINRCWVQLHPPNLRSVAIAFPELLKDKATRKTTWAFADFLSYEVPLRFGNSRVARQAR